MLLQKLRLKTDLCLAVCRSIDAAAASQGGGWQQRSWYAAVSQVVLDAPLVRSRHLDVAETAQHLVQPLKAAVRRVVGQARTILAEPVQRVPAVRRWRGVRSAVAVRRREDSRGGELCSLGQGMRGRPTAVEELGALLVCVRGQQTSRRQSMQLQDLAGSRAQESPSSVVPCRQRPPMRSVASRTMGWAPACLIACAAASPARPPPMTTTAVIRQLTAVAAVAADSRQQWQLTAVAAVAACSTHRGWHKLVPARYRHRYR